MNKKTSKVLARISRNVPAKLVNNIVKTVVDTSEEDLARAALKDPEISKNKKAKIQKLLDQGAFRRYEQVEDEEVIKKIDKYNEKAVKRAIASGEIPPPSEDEFIAKRNQRAKTSLKVTGGIIPIRDKVLIKPDEVKKDIKGPFGIILPDKDLKRNSYGKIIACGALCKYLKVGQRVIFQDYNFEPIEVDKVEHYIMSEENVIAIFQ